MKNDSEKSKLASKFANDISVATKMGGPDPGSNIRLLAAVENAQKANVPKKVIENAIKRGAGIGDGKKQVEQLVYEAVGPGGVGLVIEALTDNKNRIVSEVRAAVHRYGGSMSPCLFNFERRGYIVFEKKIDCTEEDVFEAVVDSGAEDYEIYPSEEEGIREKDGTVVPPLDLVEVSTGPSQTGAVAEKLKSQFKIKEVGIGYEAKEDLKVAVENESDQEMLLKTKKLLESMDDVTAIYSNEL